MQSCARSSDGSNLDLLDARARVCLDQQSQLVIHNNALAQVKYLYSMLPLEQQRKQRRRRNRRGYGRPRRAAEKVGVALAVCGGARRG